MHIIIFVKIVRIFNNGRPVSSLLSPLLTQTFSYTVYSISVARHFLISWSVEVLRRIKGKLAIRTRRIVPSSLTSVELCECIGITHLNGVFLDQTL